MKYPILKDSNDSLGDRLKSYENTEALLPGIPAIARLDGKAFHTFTRGMVRPYDHRLHEIMDETTKFLVHETNALIGYTQSDEISLLLYTEDPKSQLYMGGKIFKIVSILAAKCTLKFAELLQKFFPEKSPPVFDCRVNPIPFYDVSNYFIWRENDAVRNSIAALAQSKFSHNSLHGLSCEQMQEKLWKEHNINWNDCSDREKRGGYFQRKILTSKFTQEELEELPPNHNARKNPDLIIERNRVVKVKMPRFTQIVNKENVLFKGEEPKSKE